MGNRGMLSSGLPRRVFTIKNKGAPAEDAPFRHVYVSPGLHHALDDAVGLLFAETKGTVSQGPFLGQHGLGLDEG